MPLVFIISIFSALVPILFFITFIRWLDKYEREPWSHIAIIFFLGATVTSFLSFFGNSIIALIGDYYLTAEGNDYLIASIVAPVIEETNKGLIILLFAWLSHEFDNVTDGLIYGSVVGLGFAFTENIFYFLDIYETNGQFAWLNNIYLRTFFTAGLHGSASGIFGATIGYIRHSHPTQTTIISIMGWCVAIMIHSFWNAMLTVADFSADSILGMLPFIGLPCIFIGLFMLMHLLLSQERVLIARELIEEASLGIIPQEHLPYLESNKRRERNSDWLDARIPRKKYLSLTARLAFAKDIVKHAHDRKKAYYWSKITLLRRQIQELLTPLKNDANTSDHHE